MLYAGSLVVAGSGRALVVATGRQTELGRIGTLVSDIEPERTPLERRRDILGRRLAWLALFAGAVHAANGRLQRAATEIVVQTAIALAIAAVPEGLPAVATIALAVGVRRMARRNTLVRRLPSVETLGAVGIVCSDKTGTLTAGEMTVSALWLNGMTVRVSGSGYQTNGRFTSEGSELNLDERRALSAALRVGVLANRAALEVDSGGTHVRGDPTEAALLIAGRKFGLDRDSLLEETPEVGHVAFSSERMWMATLHRTGDDGFEVALKGAPDRILAMCGRVATDHSEIELDESWRSKILGENTRFATQGMRVLGLARGRAESTDIGTPRNLVFLGLAAMIDPPAPGVSETIRTLSEAGVRTVMITGDQQPTALAVAREVGIAGPDESGMDGQQLGEPGRSRTGIAHINVFSRVSPEQKLEIITAFQAAGDVVAMLGDGVNDAAALKKADIGVAMGIRGTDVAKEVASVVLRDDRFATVGTAVEQGRIIHDNIRKFVFYLFSCNLAEVLLLIGAGLAGLPVPLTPLQILWLNIVTDTFPALALAFEPAESDVMKRPPRDPSRAILSVPFLRAVVFYGIVMTGSSGAAYVWGMAAGNPVRAGTIAFMTLALAQAFHLGNARSTGPVIRPARAFANRYALGAVLLVVSLQLASVYLAPLASILGTVPLSVTDWLIVTPLALLSGVLGQAIRLTRRWRTRRAGR
jgi:Ca2+-transporting ATPase